MTSDIELPIYDIYVLNEGGVPIFAGCSTSDYCQSHSGQHPLHTGFISAMQSFGNEVFSSSIRDLRFDTVKLNFKSLDRYTLVFVNPLDTDDQFIQQKLQEVGEIFHDKYAEKIQQHTLTEEMYLNFMDDVVDIGLVAKDRIKSTRDLFISDTETETKENKSMFNKFKEKFISLIKR